MVYSKGLQESNALEGLKGILSVIIALFVHYGHFYPQNGIPSYMDCFPLITTWGWLSVELFFMISGFGMYLGYSSQIINGLSFKEYFYKRIVKIYPIYFMALVVITLLQFLYKIVTGDYFRYGNFDIYHIFIQVFLLQGGLLETDWSYFGPSWFISVVFQCYACFWYVRKKYTDDRFVWMQLVMLFITLALLTCGISYPILNSLILRGLSCFIVGTLLAYLSQNKHLNNRLISWLFIVLIIICYLVYRLYGEECIGNIHVLFILFAGPMLLWICLYNPIINKFLSCKLLVYLGTISLGIYLWHFPIQCVIKLFDIFFSINIKYESSLVSFIYLLLLLWLLFIKLVQRDMNLGCLGCLRGSLDKHIF